MARNQQDTITAIATPPGAGAIGVIRVSGPDAINRVAEVFEGKDLRTVGGYTVHFGKIVRSDKSILDEVIVNVFRTPHSYTGEDTVEISCHGSSYVLQEVLRVLQGPKVRMATPGEFTLRAFMNGKLDLTQAEAVADLIASSSEKSHELAIQQLRGGFAKQIAQLREQLIHFASLIELELDFGEEDVEFADRSQLVQLIEKIQGVIRPLMDSFKYGNAIKEGISTVLAGRPNAGKSTLLNVLLNEERAIVSDIAGTTRDTIEENLVLEGVPFRLIDTAGIRAATDAIEAIGVARTLEKISQSALLVYIFDITELSPSELHEDLAKLRKDGLEIIVVANKMDLNPYEKPEDYISKSLPKERFITASAINKMNMDYLKRVLVEVGLAGQVNRESVVISNIRHYQALVETDEALGRAMEGLNTGLSGDLIAMDIRRSLHYLGEISGEVTTDDLLENIFRKFCIGK